MFGTSDQLDRSQPVVVLIAGPPGAGKTTVVNAMVQQRKRCVLIDGDAYFQSIRTGWIPPWEPHSDGQNRTVVAAIGAAAAAFARGGFEVFIDGVIGPWMLPVLRESLGTIGLRYIVLRPSAEVTMERAVGRGEPWLVDPEPIAMMYEQFAAIGDLEFNIVDTSNMDVDQAVDAVSVFLAATEEPGTTTDS